MSHTITAAHETEKDLIQRAQTAVSQCNWTVGECAVQWTKKFARGRTDADFGELVGMSGRRGELVATNVGDFKDGKLWIIDKGKTQQQSIDLAPRTLAALEEWLAVRAGETSPRGRRCGSR